MPTLTITTSAQQATRLAAAVGIALGLRDTNGNQRSANMAEVKDYTIDKLREVVISTETQAALALVVLPTAFDPT